MYILLYLLALYLLEILVKKRIVEPVAELIVRLRKPAQTLKRCYMKTSHDNANITSVMYQMDATDLFIQPSSEE
jgi:hypothetical protein